MKTIKQVVHEHILDSLTKCNGDRRETARCLGITVKTLYKKINEMKALGFKSVHLDDDMRQTRHVVNDTYKGMPTNEERLRYLDNRP